MKITDSDITIDNLLSIEDFNHQTKDKIQNSDILLLPLLEFGDKKERVFYPETSSFYKLAVADLSDYTINICENQEEEKTLTLHSEEIWLPIILISIDPLKDVILPMVISFIYDYLIYRFPKESNKDIAHVQIIIHDKKRKLSKKLKYDGPVSGINELKKIDVNKILK